VTTLITPPRQPIGVALEPSLKVMVEPKDNAVPFVQLQGGGAPDG